MLNQHKVTKRSSLATQNYITLTFAVAQSSICNQRHNINTENISTWFVVILCIQPLVGDTLHLFIDNLSLCLFFF